MLVHMKTIGLFALPLAFMLAGCEALDLTEDVGEDDQAAPAAEQAEPQPVQQEDPADPAPDPAPGPADGEWDSIVWHTAKGPACPGAVQVMTLSAKISGDGNTVSFSWNTYPWKDMGLGHFFVWEGDHWRGGKFDWIRAGGQSSKSLENVHSGYNGLSVPPPGTRCAFAWTDADGKTRSNLAETVWP